MYLIQHPNEFIESLIQEGYQKPEAVQILNYMVGQEGLNLDQAKQRVNEEIEQGKFEKEEQKGERANRTRRGRRRKNTMGRCRRQKK